MKTEKEKQEELLEQVNLRLYDLFSNSEKHKEEWEEFGITQEQANKEIAAYHKKFGIPDLTKLQSS